MQTGLKLFHFCADFMLPEILRFGITKGKLVISTDPPKYRAGFQWLTKNPSFDQPFDRNSTLDYDRTANRIQVVIPDNKLKKLYPWLEFGENLAGPLMFQTLNFRNDPENWYMYHGQIKPEWFVDIVPKKHFYKV